MRRPLLAAASLAVLLTASLAACTPETSPPTPTPSPTSSATPLFASDEEALAAAEEAYVRFQSVSDVVLREGGSGADRIKEVATGELLVSESTSYSEFEANGWRLVGESKVVVFTLQSFRPFDSEGTLVAYACVDLAGVDVVDPSGQSVVLDSRPDRQGFQIVFDATEDPSRLIPSFSEPWETESACAL